MPTRIKKSSLDSPGSSIYRFSDEFDNELPCVTPSTSKTYLKKRGKGSFWNAPRRVKAVDSMGMIMENNCSSTRKDNKIKPSKRNKYRKKMLKILQHYKRIEQLAQPRLIMKKTILQQQQVPNFPKITTTSKLISLAKKREYPLQKNPNPFKPNNFVQFPYISERLARLAEPKERDSIPINLLGKVSERALFATASKRITELAMPKGLSNRSNAEEKERNPFKVSPQALKAVCSPRMGELAKPKKYRTLFTESNSSSQK